MNKTNSPSHCKQLERMYLSAPFNALFQPQIQVQEGQATITIELKPDYHHAANAVHGSVYFKMLDDAAYFAANSLEPEFFMLTTTFTTYLTRPVSEGTLRAVGRVVNQNRSQIIAEAVVYNAADREIGRGNGVFVRSKNRLNAIAGYRGDGGP
ncbi:PaaI family thioesterase [Marinicella meishanensis]|uniref:PaaI family thioesterase n=1 Tax=Marinicella meishanensis TaxID=2873263 RepID=UPI001CBD01EE|nr:PaaI family thioesterase [Marinicella sp. NBU2979]